MLYVWYPKNRTDLNTIHEENDVIGLEELARVKAQLKRGKQEIIYSYQEIIGLLSRDHKTPIKRLQDLFNYEDGTPKSLYDSLRSLRDPASRSFITGLLQDSYQEIIGLL